MSPPERSHSGLVGKGGKAGEWACGKTVCARCAVAFYSWDGGRVDPVLIERARLEAEADAT